MNKDQVKGKVKDAAGRVERQVGEWTGDEKKQVHGAAKQVEGKGQNAWGDVKEASKDAAEKRTPNRTNETDSVETEDEEVRSRRKAG